MEAESATKRFSDMVIAQKRARGLTVVGLAKLMGVSPTWVCAWLRGKTLPRQKDVPKVLRALGDERESEVRELIRSANAAKRRTRARYPTCPSCGCRVNKRTGTAKRIFAVVSLQEYAKRERCDT